MALKWLRDQFKHLKIVLWGVVAVFVLLVFVDWGTGRQQGPTGNYAIKVGDQEISERDFLLRLRQEEQQYQQMFGDQWSQLRSQVNVASRLAQQLIMRELEVAEAKELGLRVSEQELQDEILSYPMFQRDGGGFVGPDAYRRFLSANQLTPQAFESTVIDDILTRKLRSMVEEGVWVSDDEVEEQLRRTRELSDFDAIQIRYERFLPETVVSDGEIAAYYDAHQDELQRDEQRSVRYLLVDTGRLRRVLPVEDAEIAAFYAEHRSEFLEPEKARARHVLLRFSPDDPESKSQAKLTADSVAAMARAGADFAELAAKYSADPGTKDQGGDLGWFGRGRMVKEFEDAVFAAKPGDIVGPVESQFGYHVIKVEGHQPARERPLEEVRDQVRFRLLEGRAGAEAETRALALAKRIKSEKPDGDESWQQIADGDEVLTLNFTPPVTAGESVPGLGDDVALTAEIFAAEPGQVHGPRAVSRGWIVWQLKDVRPAGVPPIEEVRDQVSQKLARAKAVEQAVEAGRGLAERWRAGADGEALAAEVGATVARARDHRRSGVVPGGLGVIADLDRAVFAAADGDVVGPVELADRGTVIAKVERVVRLDPTRIASESDLVRSQLMQEKGEQLLSSILAERRRTTLINVNSELLARFEPQGS